MESLVFPGAGKLAAVAIPLRAPLTVHDATGDETPSCFADSLASSSPRSSRRLGRRRRPLGLPSPPANTVVAGTVPTPSCPASVLVSFLESHYNSCMHRPAQIEPLALHAPATRAHPPPASPSALIPATVGHGTATHISV
uniref:Uncharacterized protein n=1 Tax=Leersia perrieri TaxID=77586 RepID=A0A0D9XR66_9ORYZ